MTALESALNGNLIIIGEIVKSLDNKIKDKHPEVDWSAAAKLRDILAHHYYKIDKDIVLNTVVNDLPGLRSVCSKEINGFLENKTYTKGFGF